MDDLERTVEMLKRSLAAAWRDLAQSSGSTVDKREMRAQAKRCSEELKRCLLIVEARQRREHAKVLSAYERRTLPRPHLRVLLVEAVKGSNVDLNADVNVFRAKSSGNQISELPTSA